MKRLVVVGSGLLLLLGTVRAEAKTVVDPRAGAVGAFFRCVRGLKCPINKVFVGQKAIKEFSNVDRKRKQRGIRVKSWGMVTYVPKQHRARWKGRWSPIAGELGQAGFNGKALAKLGLGRSMVYAKPRVAVAMIFLTYERSGRTKTAHLLMVLWKIKHRWYVAYWEDSPTKIKRFVVNKRPP